MRDIDTANQVLGNSQVDAEDDAFAHAINAVNAIDEEAARAVEAAEQSVQEANSPAEAAPYVADEPEPVSFL